MSQGRPLKRATGCFSLPNSRGCVRFGFGFPLILQLDVDIPRIFRPHPILISWFTASSSSPKRQVPSIHLDVIWECFETASYQSTWKCWTDWSYKSNSDPLFPPLTVTLQYPTGLFDSGLATSSINVHRSMLTMTLDPIESHKVGEHPLVIHLLKGCFNLKPPQPRYNSLLDPNVVLKYFDSLGHNKHLTLSALSRKLAMLLALSSVSRVSEICAISFPSIQFSASAASFSLSRPKKAQKSGPLKSLSLPKFGGLCCPVTCLQDSIAVTNEWRVAGKSLSFSVSPKTTQAHWFFNFRALP
ncbi:Uncharacterized protein APZ42_030221 [Daphnia magna]|uniref:Uncharacterized protein n=1 Tax=Daphnia magna TaxID=35525 RepID=A0A164NYQ4_9CRUS|nr:Uncharacterized protein APZ42_030221 [Daphnia magna]